MSDRIRRLVDRQTPKIRRLLLEALRLSRGVSRDEITGLLELGDVEGALRAALNLPGLEGLRRDLRDLLLAVVDAAGGVEAAGFRMDFAAANPGAVRVAEVLAANAVTNVSLETKQAVRRIIVDGLRDGVAPRESARLIELIVGLTERDALALQRYRIGLGDDPRADRLAERYADRLLRRRAELIARTETINAETQGRRLAWQQAADQGLLYPQTTRIEWVVTPDDRLCPNCAVMAGMTVGFYDGFTQTERATGDLSRNTGAERYTGPTRPLSEFVTVNGPPLHPACRCDLTLAL